MMQRTQLSTALTILGVAGFLTAVGATGFSVVTARNLSAAAEPLAAPVAEKEPLDLDLQPRPLKPAPAPQPVVPVLPIAAPHAAQQAVSFRGVPAFTEIEAKAEAALNSPITVSFKDTDLTSALEKLSELAGVSVRQAAQKGLNEILQENDAKPLTLEFSNQPLRTVLAGVYKVALELKSDDSLGPGIRITAAPTENGIEVGVASHGPADERETRVYLVGHLLREPEDTRQILNLLYDKAGGYWTVSAEGNLQGVRAGRMTMPITSDDVGFMALFAGSIVHLKSLGALVVNANPQAHFEIVRTLRLLDEVSQVAAQQN